MTRRDTTKLFKLWTDCRCPTPQLQSLRYDWMGFVRRAKCCSTKLLSGQKLVFLIYIHIYICNYVYIYNNIYIIIYVLNNYIYKPKAYWAPWSEKKTRDCGKPIRIGLLQCFNLFHMYSLAHFRCLGCKSTYYPSLKEHCHVVFLEFVPPKEKVPVLEVDYFPSATCKQMTRLKEGWLCTLCYLQSKRCCATSKELLNCSHRNRQTAKLIRNPDTLRPCCKPV